MFAQHNGQVCFLSLCARAAIVAEEDAAAPGPSQVTFHRHSPGVSF